MATLRFRGSDFRDLIDTLAQAVKLSANGERPVIEVNGMIISPNDVNSIAGLMPQAPLSTRHRVVGDQLVTDKPATYRTAAASLARRTHEASNAGIRRQKRG